MKTRRIISLMLVLIMALTLALPSFAKTTVQTKEILESNGFVFERIDDHSVIIEYTGSEKNVVIPSMLGTCFVTEIYDYAFAFNETIESVVIPEKVKTIWGSAFAYCPSLKSIHIPAATTEIYSGAFSGSGLESITVAEENPAFCDVDGVLYTKAKDILVAYPSGRTDTSYTVLDGVQSIDDSAFEDCLYIEEVVFPESLLTIGSGAFWGAEKLNSVTFPASLLTIGDYVFYNCDSLVSVFIPKALTMIGGYAFGDNDSLIEIKVDPQHEVYCDVDGVLFSKDKSTLITYPSGIENESYVIPEQVRVIGRGGMAGNNYLKSVTIPEGVHTIDGWAFDGSFEIEEINIPKSVKNIGECAFRYCDSLENITVTEGNAEFCSIDGVLFNSNKTTLIVYPAGKTESEYTIPDGVEVIAVSAFAMAFNLETLIFPDSINYVDWAFEACVNLKSVVIPKGVTRINDDDESNIFYDCEELVIYGELDSAAYTYAITHGIPFVEGLPDSGTSFIEVGDINADGKFNSRDVAALQKYLVGLSKFNDEQLMLADYNGDGKVNSRDIAAMQKVLLS